jgi:hypothetical protein
MDVRQGNPFKICCRTIAHKNKIFHYCIHKVFEIFGKGNPFYFFIDKMIFSSFLLRFLWYMSKTMCRYYNRKSQRRSSLYRQQAYEKLIKKYGLVDALKYKPTVHFQMLSTD